MPHPLEGVGPLHRVHSKSINGGWPSKNHHVNQTFGEVEWKKGGYEPELWNLKGTLFLMELKQLVVTLYCLSDYFTQGGCYNPRKHLEVI